MKNVSAKSVKAVIKGISDGSISDTNILLASLNMAAAKREMVEIAFDLGSAVSEFHNTDFVVRTTNGVTIRPVSVSAPWLLDRTLQGKRFDMICFSVPPPHVVEVFREIGVRVVSEDA